MLDLILITSTFVDLFRQIPELPQFLANGDLNMIVGYIDANPTPQSLQTAEYQMPQGSILVALREGQFDQGESMSYLKHTLETAIRSVEGTSVMAMLTALVNGVPAGESLRWRLLQPLPELYGTTDYLGYERRTDSQQIDYFVAKFELKETGDA